MLAQSQLPLHRLLTLTLVLCFHLPVLRQVAVDFVSPESMAEALAAREALRAADQALPQPLGEGPEQREFQVGAQARHRVQESGCS
jgi:hypothetical protein